MQLYFHCMPVQGCLDSTCFSRCPVMRVDWGRYCMSLYLFVLSVCTKGICQSHIEYVLYCPWCQRSHEGPKVGEHSCCCPADPLLTVLFSCLAVQLWTHSFQPSSEENSPSTIFNSLSNLQHKKSVCYVLIRLELCSWVNVLWFLLPEHSSIHFHTLDLVLAISSVLLGATYFFSKVQT